MSRILVTGASGFVGRPAVRALLEGGHEVHALSRSREQPELPGVHWHGGSLHDEAGMRRVVAEVRPSHLLHLAWFVEPKTFWHAPQNLAWVGCSLRLLQAFVESGGERAVMAGSCAEYPWTKQELSEDEPTAPATLYGTCKDAVHRVAAAFAERMDFQLAWGRIFFLYGPHEPDGRLVSSVTRSLLLGEPALCSAGEQRRDFLHVDDAGRAFAALVESSCEGAFNVASGRAVAVKDVVRCIGDLTGAADLLRLGALPTRPDEPAQLSGPITRIQSTCGWRPSYSLEEGLLQTVDWWRARLRSDGLLDS